jgi:hypothetical protein
MSQSRPARGGGGSKIPRARSAQRGPGLIFLRKGQDICWFFWVNFRILVLKIEGKSLDSICNVLVLKNFLTLKWYTDRNFFGDVGGGGGSENFLLRKMSGARVYKTSVCPGARGWFSPALVPIVLGNCTFIILSVMGGGGLLFFRIHVKGGH